MKVLHLTIFFVIFNFVIGFLGNATDVGEVIEQNPTYNDSVTYNELINVTDVGDQVDNSLSWGRSTATGQGWLGKFEQYFFGMGWFIRNAFGLPSVANLFEGIMSILYGYTLLQFLRGVGGKSIE